MKDKEKQDMPHCRLGQPNAPIPDSGRVFGVGPSDQMRRVLQELRDGGPPVDEEAVYRYIANALDEPTMRLIGSQIASWKSWYLFYSDVVDSLELNSDQMTHGAQSDEPEVQ